MTDPDRSGTESGWRVADQIYADHVLPQTRDRPAWGRGTPFPLVPPLLRLLPFLAFPYLVGFNYSLLLSFPSLSTKIVPLRFQAGGRMKRPFILCFL